MKTGEEIKQMYYNGDKCTIPGVSIKGTPVVNDNGITTITFVDNETQQTFPFTYDQNHPETLQNVFLFVAGDTGSTYATSLQRDAVQNPNDYAVLSVDNAYARGSTVTAITNALSAIAEENDITYNQIISSGSSAGAVKSVQISLALNKNNNIDTNNPLITVFWDASGQGSYTYTSDGRSAPGVVQYFDNNMEEVNNYVANGGIYVDYISREFGQDGTRAMNNFRPYAEQGIPIIVVVNPSVGPHVAATTMNYTDGEIDNLMNGFDLNSLNLNGTTEGNEYWVFEDGNWKKLDNQKKAMSLHKLILIH